MRLNSSEQLFSTIHSWNYRIEVDLFPASFGNDPLVKSNGGAMYGFQLHSNGPQNYFRSIIAGAATGIRDDYVDGFFDTNFPFAFAFDCNSSLRCLAYNCGPSFYCDSTCVYAANESAPYIEYNDTQQRQWLSMSVVVEPVGNEEASLSIRIIDESNTIRLNETLMVNRRYSLSNNGTVGLMLSSGQATYRNFRVYGKTTSEPTAVPTGEPSPVPTGEPSPFPTGEPSPSPTGEPSPFPTIEPSPSPTIEPSSSPTIEPSSSPTIEPSSSPTIEPSSITTNIEEPTDESTPIFLIVTLVIVSTTLCIVCFLYNQQRWKNRERPSNEHLVIERHDIRDVYDATMVAKKHGHNASNMYEMVILNNSDDETIDETMSYQSADNVRRHHQSSTEHIYQNMVLDDELYHTDHKIDVDHQSTTLDAYGETTLDTTRRDNKYDHVSVPL
jgi:hypothetical protein